MAVAHTFGMAVTHTYKQGQGGKGTSNRPPVLSNCCHFVRHQVHRSQKEQALPYPSATMNAQRLAQVGPWKARCFMSHDLCVLCMCCACKLARHTALLLPASTHFPFAACLALLALGREQLGQGGKARGKQYKEGGTGAWPSGHLVLYNNMQKHKFSQDRDACTL